MVRIFAWGWNCNIFSSKKIKVGGDLHYSNVNEMIDFRNNYLIGMEGASILDIGSRCAEGQENTICYRNLFENDFKYVGMDIVSGENVNIVGFANIPEVFDVVISGSVMEHVKRPWIWLKLLKRYFKTYICIITVHTWHEHRHPLDTYRYFPDGMRALFDYASIKEVKIYKNETDTIGIGTKF